MPVKVKRGLGLLVVALIALLGGYAAEQSGSTTIYLLAGVAAVTFIAALVAGLVLIAWGLLRD